MREKSDDDICFPGDKIPDRSASRNIIVYKNPCLDKRRERKETDGTIFRRIVTGVPLFVMGLYEKNGRPLEKVLGDVIQTVFLRPKQRPYQTDNLYAALMRQEQMEREVQKIVRQTKTHP